MGNSFFTHSCLLNNRTVSSVNFLTVSLHSRVKMPSLIVSLAANQRALTDGTRCLCPVIIVGMDNYRYRTAGMENGLEFILLLSRLFINKPWTTFTVVYSCLRQMKPNYTTQILGHSNLTPKFYHITWIFKTTNHQLGLCQWLSKSHLVTCQPMGLKPVSGVG